MKRQLLAIALGFACLAGMSFAQATDTSAKSYFLDTFGRPLRVTACECERSTDPNLGQALHLMNGDLVNRKVSGGNRTWIGAAAQGILTSIFRTCSVRQCEPIGYFTRILRIPSGDALPDLAPGGL